MMRSFEQAITVLCPVAGLSALRSERFRINADDAVSRTLDCRAYA